MLELMNIRKSYEDGRIAQRNGSSLIKDLCLCYQGLRFVISDFQKYLTLNMVGA